MVRVGLNGVFNIIASDMMLFWVKRQGSRFFFDRDSARRRGGVLVSAQKVHACN